MACRTEPYPPADWCTGTLSLASAQRKYAAECRRAYDVSVQDALWRAALGAGLRDPTHGSAGQMRGAQSDDPVGLARDGACGMIRTLIKEELFVTSRIVQQSPSNRQNPRLHLWPPCRSGIGETQGVTRAVWYPSVLHRWLGSISPALGSWPACHQQAKNPTVGTQTSHTTHPDQTVSEKEHLLFPISSDARSCDWLFINRFEFGLAV